MATYPIDYLMVEYGNERMSVEMVAGHCLQHLKQLQEALDTANNRRQELRNQLATLVNEIETLQEKVKRWQKQTDQLNTKMENSLAAINHTVYQLKADVDSLKSQFANEMANSAKK